MKLKTKVIYVTSPEGRHLDLDGVSVDILLNGKKSGKTLADVLAGYREFDRGEIYGQSLLSYYNLQDDGSLFVDGSHLQLQTEDGTLVKITRIKRPTLNDDCSIPFKTVQQFASDFAIAKPEEVFTDLNDEEKAVFVAEREKEEATTRAQKAQAEKELQDAEAARVAKVKEDDKALRAQMKEGQLHEEESFKELQAYYKGKGCKEYTTDPYTVFFGANSDEEPCLLVKRTTDPAIRPWYQEPEQTAYEDDGSKIVISFDDLGKKKTVELNPETGEIKTPSLNQ